MAEIIEMPKLSDTMEEGAIASWLKKEGEFVEEGEAIVEIETDKATMEYNSPEEGYLLKIIVPAGKSCDLNAPIAVLGQKDESVDLDSLLGGKSSPKEARPEENKQESSSGKEPARAGAHAAERKTSETNGRLRASPLARKVARENKLDLSQISGSGPSGRVVIRDVEAALNSGVSAKAPDSRSEPAPESKIEAYSSSVVSSGAGDQDIPNSMMRKTIAKRLLQGKNEAPHFYLTVSADMAKLLDWRKQLNQDIQSGDEATPKVSVNDLIVLAVARALVKHPAVNSSWQGNTIRRFGSVDISMAVAIPDGLITPIIHGAHALGVREIARRSKDLVQKAKSNSLKPEEFQGGTFSISNLGMMGIEEFTAIINPPQAAILAVGATIPTPWVGGNGELVVQQRMKMTLSCDHRVIDGATGAQFLQTLKSYLENPLAMLS